MNTETKWRVVWGSWVVVGVAAEVAAILTKHDHAPLSHHLRQNTHVLGKTQAGQVVLLFGATWLHRHLYRPLLDEAGAIPKNQGQRKSGENDLGNTDLVLRVGGDGDSTYLRARLDSAIRRINLHRVRAR